jgi:hypothetical protein
VIGVPSRHAWSDLRGQLSVPDFERKAEPTNAIELGVADPPSRRYM